MSKGNKRSKLIKFSILLIFLVCIATLFFLLHRLSLFPWQNLNGKIDISSDSIGSFSWNEIDKSDGYEIVVFDKDRKNIIEKYEKYEYTYFQIDKNNDNYIPGSEYYIEVRAYKKQFVKFKYSKAGTLKFLYKKQIDISEYNNSVSANVKFGEQINIDLTVNGFNNLFQYYDVILVKLIAPDGSEKIYKFSLNNSADQNIFSIAVDEPGKYQITYQYIDNDNLYENTEWLHRNSPLETVVNDNSMKFNYNYQLIENDFNNGGYLIQFLISDSLNSQVIDPAQLYFDSKSINSPKIYHNNIEIPKRYIEFTKITIDGKDYGRVSIKDEYFYGLMKGNDTFAGIYNPSYRFKFKFDHSYSGDDFLYTHNCELEAPVDNGNPEISSSLVVAKVHIDFNTTEIKLDCILRNYAISAITFNSKLIDLSSDNTSYYIRWNSDRKNKALFHSIQINIFSLKNFLEIVDENTNEILSKQYSGKITFKKVTTGETLDKVFEVNFINDNLLKSYGPRGKHFYYRNDMASLHIPLKVNNNIKITDIEVYGASNILEDNNLSNLISLKSLANTTEADLILNKAFFDNFNIGQNIILKLKFSNDIADSEIVVHYISNSSKKIIQFKDDITTIDSNENTEILYKERYGDTEFDFGGIIIDSFESDENGKNKNNADITLAFNKKEDISGIIKSKSLVLNKALIEKLKNGRYEMIVKSKDYGVFIQSIFLDVQCIRMLNLDRLSSNEYQFTYESGSEISKVKYGIKNKGDSVAMWHETLSKKIDINVSPDSLDQNKVLEIIPMINGKWDASKGVSYDFIIPKTNANIYINNPMRVYGKDYSRYVDNEDLFRTLLKGLVLYGNVKAFETQTKFNTITRLSLPTYATYTKNSLSWSGRITQTKFEVYLDAKYQNTISNLDKIKGIYNDALKEIQEAFSNEISISYDNSNPKVVFILTSKTQVEADMSKQMKTSALNDRKETDLHFAINNLRAATYDGFKVNTKEESKEVEFSDDLVKVLENGYKPIVKSGSSAEMVYNKAKEILRKIVSDDMNDYQKVRAVIDYFIYKANYEHNILPIFNELNNTNNIHILYDHPVFFAEGVLNNSDDEGFLVCNGYAKAMSIMLNIEGIETLKFSGLAGTYGHEDHAWNRVKIYDSWYLFDTTWHNPKIGTEDGYPNNFWLFTPDLEVLDIKNKEYHVEDHLRNPRYKNAFVPSSLDLEFDKYANDVFVYDLNGNGSIEFDEIFSRVVRKKKDLQALVAYKRLLKNTEYEDYRYVDAILDSSIGESSVLEYARKNAIDDFEGSFYSINNDNEIAKYRYRKINRLKVKESP